MDMDCHSKASEISQIKTAHCLVTSLNMNTIDDNWHCKGAWKGFFHPFPLVTLFWGARGQSNLKGKIWNGIEPSTSEHISLFHQLL